jgi:hypothetical protein
MTVSRLSDLSIEDDIRRVQLYRQILAFIRDNPGECRRYEVKADEEFRVDLASQRIYGTPELEWLVLLVCNMDDLLAGLPVGFSVLFPPLATVRQMIRAVKDGE